MVEDYGVTGARAEVEELVEVPVEKLWTAITDLSRIGEWSPECTYSGWLDGWTGPEVGARFEGRNRFPNGFVSEVVCVVTEADAPRTFAYEVFDEDPDAEVPFATWRYELRPADGPGGPDGPGGSGGAGRTVVRQSFTHGPGDSGARAAVLADRANATAVLEGRLSELRHNMSATITAMARDVGDAHDRVG